MGAVFFFASIVYSVRALNRRWRRRRAAADLAIELGWHYNLEWDARGRFHRHRPRSILAPYVPGIDAPGCRPREYERDALYAITPDVMALMVDEAPGFDMADGRWLLTAVPAVLTGMAWFGIAWAQGLIPL